MNRAQLTEKILDIKREKGWTWKHITDEIGGMSPVLVVGALLGQMKLVKPLAKKAAGLFGLSAAEERMLNEVPYRGTPMPPTASWSPKPTRPGPRPTPSSKPPATAAATPSSPHSASFSMRSLRRLAGGAYASFTPYSRIPCSLP